MKRWCQTILQNIYSCQEWKYKYKRKEYWACTQEPMEKNCTNMIDEKKIRCPMCKNLGQVE